MTLEERRAKKRAWVEANREHVKQYRREWTRKNRERVNQCQREWNSKNRDKLRRYARFYFAEHKEAVLEQQRLYVERHRAVLSVLRKERYAKLSAERKARIRQLQRAWWLLHPEAKERYYARRRLLRQRLGDLMEQQDCPRSAYQNSYLMGPTSGYVEGSASQRGEEGATASSE